jgi:2,4-dienoyl-CoA reductase-like NADH-dependent reductase (Old Yellow Enzyme family)
VPEDHPLLTSVELASLTLANRVAVAPMSRVSTAGDGVPTESMSRYFRELAEGGFGLIFTDGTYTDHAFSQGYPDQPAIATDEQVEAWGRVVDAVHAADTPIVMQLMHAGALVQGNRHRDGCIGPSAVPPKGRMLRGYGGPGGPYSLPREMTGADIAEVLAGIASSARRAEEAGFDGVEIHAANGYLFDQFITRYANRRTDRYGGSPENRARLAAEAIRAADDATGPGFFVGVRLSQVKVNDLDYRWAGVDEARALLATVGAAGPAYVHIASEGAPWAETSFLAPGVSTTGLAREVCGVPVIANGGMHDPGLAARLLGEGHCDLVSLGHGAVADPDWPRRLAAGEPPQEFEAGMLEPEVTVENTARWRREHGGRSAAHSYDRS